MKHIHLMGIGGIGMSAIAQLLLKKGLRISGCDLKESELIDELRANGAHIWMGHSPLHLESVDTLVHSSAIRPDNPEFGEAKRRGIQVMKRAQILAYLMQDKTTVTVSGMHGKTTTASLAACLLSEAGLLPTIAVGGIIRSLGSNVSLGEGRFFVAEADESDGSFLYYQPDYSIITNIDYEHLDYYQDFDSILEVFWRFINQTRNGGCLFYCFDDPNLRNLLKGYKKRAVSFGLSADANIYAANIKLYGLCSEFDGYQNGQYISHFRLNLAGRHNISNSLSAIALGLELGIDTDLIKSVLFNYKGTRRRLEVKFKSEDFLVLDDYGHHPTEIKATLEAVRGFCSRKLLVIFQPHRYTRTKLLLDSFVMSFDLADYLIICDIYPAGEPPIEGISGYSIYEKIKQRGHPEAKFLFKQEISARVLEILSPGDVVLVLGAGDITKVGDELASILQRESQGKRAISKAH